MGSIRAADRAVIESMLSQVSLQRHPSIALINGFFNPSIPCQGLEDAIVFPLCLYPGSLSDSLCGANFLTPLPYFQNRGMKRTTWGLNQALQRLIRAISIPRLAKRSQPRSIIAATITPGSGTGTISLPEKAPDPRNWLEVLLPA